MKTGWDSLTDDLIQLIADKLTAVEDLLALTGVCRYFRSSVQGHPCEVWLLLSRLDDKNPKNDERMALSMYNKKTLSMDLPELQGRKAFGTPYGWIITLGLDLQLHLFNPLNRRRIILPPPKVGPAYTDKYRRFWTRLRFMKRAILIKRPPFGSDDFFVVVIGNFGQLSIFRSEKNTWETVTLDGLRGGRCDVCVEDIAYYDGQIYVVGPMGRFFIYSNLDGPGLLTKVRDILRRYRELQYAHNLYLVESSGDFLLVGRCQRFRKIYFKVFKLNQQTKELILVKDLGDRSLFVGDSQSISLSSPESFNCRCNCIYFAEDDVKNSYIDRTAKERDMGVYHLETGTVQHFSSSANRFPDATWFIPSFS